MTTEMANRLYIAQQVRDVACRLTGAARPWNGRKVLLAALWDAMCTETLACEGCDWSHFARWMIEANRDGLIELNRCDLPCALTPESLELLARSEIDDGIARFHFLVAEAA